MMSIAEASISELTTLEIVVVALTSLLVAWPFRRRKASSPTEPREP